MRKIVCVIIKIISALWYFSRCGFAWHARLQKLEQRLTKWGPRQTRIFVILNNTKKNMPRDILLSKRLFVDIQDHFMLSSVAYFTNWDADYEIVILFLNLIFSHFMSYCSE